MADEAKLNKPTPLTPRELRAAAAIARIDATTVRRGACSKCGGKLDKTFERYEFMYCSTGCMQAHKAEIGR